MEVAAAARASIVDAAEGNPLFLEEMLAYVAEGDELEAGLDIPPTIHALLAARLDRLPDDERAVLEAAAVEGKVFHESSVGRLLSRERGAVDAELRVLLRKDLIRPDRGVFARERAYRFRHLLIRDAAYESIPKAQRARLHVLHADWLRAATVDGLLELDEILGYHLGQAYRYRAELAPLDDETRALGRRAAERLGEAGRRAFVRSDAPAALNLIARAVDLLPPDDPQRVGLVPNARVMQGSSGDFGWAETVLAEAIETGDPRLQAHASIQRGFLRLFTEPDVRPADLVETASSAIRTLTSPPDELGLARAWRLIAQAEYLARRGARSAEASERALVHARRATDGLEEFETVQWLAVALFLGPEPAAQAAARCQLLLDEFAGKAGLEVTVLGALSYLFAIQGRFRDAFELLERGRRAVAGLGEGWHFSVFIGWLALWHQDPVAAENELRPAYETLKRVGERAHFCTVASVLARIADACGRYDEAFALTRECEETSRPNDVECQIHWRGTRAKVLARGGELAEAELLAGEAVSLGESSDFLACHGDALVDLAEVLSLGGRAGEGEGPVEAAIALYERKGDVVSAERAAALLGELRASRVRAQ